MKIRRPCRLTMLSCSISTLAVLAACGGAPPPAPVTPTMPLAVASEPPPDVTAVPEPSGLMLVGRVNKPDAILKTLGLWSHFPVPGGADLVRSIADDAAADAVDLTRSVDAAIALPDAKRRPKPLIAVSVAVRSFADAKAKLGAKHKLTPGENGQLWMTGFGGTGTEHDGDAHDEEGEDGASCALTHASAGARLVCGKRAAVEALAPYLARTVARQNWPSDVHLEMTLGALREPLMEARSGLPRLGRAIFGGAGAATGQLVESGITEVVDVVGDTSRWTFDAQIADAGVEAVVRVDYASATSLLARLAMSHVDRGVPPPSAFLHLPADTDLASYGEGSDPKLFDSMRELIGNVALEVADGAGMPEGERKIVRDLLVDRGLSMLTGPFVYGKGFDALAVDKALAAKKDAKAGDLAAIDEASTRLLEQAVGWHLVNVAEPISKVGPMLKDWAALWRRPAFAKWAKQKASGKMLAQVRMAPLPAGAALPKDAVHLEIVVPRADLEDAPVPPRKPGKKIRVRPISFHVLAVPDQGATWIGLGLDGKLLAQKAAASLSTAPMGPTLATAFGTEALRNVRASGASFATLRGLLVLTALGRHHERSPFAMLGTLPAKGQTPIVLTYSAKGPSDAAKVGSVVGTFTLPRAAIEDLVKIALASQ